MNDYKLLSDIGFECVFFIKDVIFCYFNEDLNATVTVNKNGWEISHKSPITNLIFRGLKYRQQKKILKLYDMNAIRLQEYNKIIVTKCNRLVNYLIKEEV